MKDSRAANRDENKKYIDGRVQEIGGELDLAGLTTEWEDPQDKTTGTYYLSGYDPGHTDFVVIPFSARDLGWKTYYPDAGQNVEAFLEYEKKLRPDSYDRKQKWDERIRQALSGFGQSNNPIGFSS